MADGWMRVERLAGWKIHVIPYRVQLQDKKISTRPVKCGWKGGGREDEARATIASRDGRNRRQKG